METENKASTKPHSLGQADTQFGQEGHLETEGFLIIS